MTSVATRPADFEDVYRHHVAMVLAGELKEVMKDMAPGCVPAVFEGVTVPRDEVSAADVVTARVDGDRAVGEAVYTTPDGPIGLRSGWGLVDGVWQADTLENFPAGER
ncbi:hypothetical protein [Streptomyces sp. NPDC005799]|uniref:hypothetical protein n=1 Tax=Streptomyces sp. NPDC005799 TaxID=3154678 RepID=UPI003400F29D